MAKTVSEQVREVALEVRGLFERDAARDRAISLLSSELDHAASEMVARIERLETRLIGKIEQLESRLRATEVENVTLKQQLQDGLVQYGVAGGFARKPATFFHKSLADKMIGTFAAITYSPFISDSAT